MSALASAVSESNNAQELIQWAYAHARMTGIELWGKERRAEGVTRVVVLNSTMQQNAAPVSRTTRVRISFDFHGRKTRSIMRNRLQTALYKAIPTQIDPYPSAGVLCVEIESLFVRGIARVLKERSPYLRELVAVHAYGIRASDVRGLLDMEHLTRLAINLLPTRKSGVNRTTLKTSPVLDGFAHGGSGSLEQLVMAGALGALHTDDVVDICVACPNVDDVTVMDWFVTHNQVRDLVMALNSDKRVFRGHDDDEKWVIQAEKTGQHGMPVMEVVRLTRGVLQVYDGSGESGVTEVTPEVGADGWVVVGDSAAAGKGSSFFDGLI